MALTEPAVSTATAGGTPDAAMATVATVAGAAAVLAAVVVIGAAFSYLVRRRHLGSVYRRTLWLGIGLVAAFGAARASALVGMLWPPLAPVSLTIEAMLSVLALAGATLLASALPKLLAEPSSRELMEAQQRRAAEDDERRMMVGSLIQLNNELEQRVADRTSELAEVTKRFERALAGSNITVVEQDAELRYTWVYNAPTWMDGAAMLGLTPAHFMPEEAARQLMATKRRVLETGRSERAQLTYEQDGEMVWFDERVEPLVRDERVVGTVTVAIDVSAHKRYEQRLRALLRELTHRSKNLLAVVQGIARQTAESVETMPDFIARFGARLQALSSVHELLVGRSWQGVELGELVVRELETEIVDLEERVSMSGERELLTPEVAQNLALGLHEMATNAVRHGALSVPEGRVAIGWRRVGDPDRAMLELTWRESGGPPVEPPASRSFGRSLIERLVPRAIDGASDLMFESDGLAWTLRFPVKRDHLEPPAA
jgi:two-component sensor histidine kinase